MEGELEGLVEVGSDEENFEGFEDDGLLLGTALDG